MIGTIILLVFIWFIWRSFFRKTAAPNHRKEAVLLTPQRSVTVEVLGAHVDDRVTQLRDTRLQRDQAAQEAYRARLEDIVERRRLSFLTNLWYMLVGIPPAPTPEPASQEESIWKAGSEGEAQARDALSACLPDGSLLFMGYRNRKGEIDLLAVTPDVVLVVETKTMNGAVRVAGDSWVRDKYDKYGNCVEVDLPVRDRGGRSPSAQLNAPANDLEQFIQKRGYPECEVRRAIILTHPRARIEAVTAPTVDIICRADQLAERLRGLKPSMANGLPVEAIAGLIRKDHAFHAAPPKRGVA